MAPQQLWWSRTNFSKNCKNIFTISNQCKSIIASVSVLCVYFFRVLVVFLHLQLFMLLLMTTWMSFSDHKKYICVFIDFIRKNFHPFSAKSTVEQLPFAIYLVLFRVFSLALVGCSRSFVVVFVCSQTSWVGKCTDRHLKDDGDRMKKVEDCWSCMAWSAIGIEMKLNCYYLSCCWEFRVEEKWGKVSLGEGREVFDRN
jgi:hypothetical protein